MTATNRSRWLIGNRRLIAERLYGYHNWKILFICIFHYNNKSFDDVQVLWHHLLSGLKYESVCSWYSSFSAHVEQSHNKHDPSIHKLKYMNSDNNAKDDKKKRDQLDRKTMVNGVVLTASSLLLSKKKNSNGKTEWKDWHFTSVLMTNQLIYH